MSSAQDIAHRLRADMLNGTISPGQELRQEELAARFDVSRMPIRDALNLLARDRLVTLRPNRGGRAISLAAREIEEIYDLRILLETDALDRAFNFIDAKALEDIKLEMRRCEVEAGTPDFPKADWHFHQALYAPAGRSRQIMMIKELRDVCQMHQAAYANLKEAKSRWSDDHQKIVGAIEIGKQQIAESLLEDHLREAGRLLRGFVSEERDASS